MVMQYAYCIYSFQLNANSYLHNDIHYVQGVPKNTLLGFLRKTAWYFWFPQNYRYTTDTTNLIFFK